MPLATAYTGTATTSAMYSGTACSATAYNVWYMWTSAATTATPYNIAYTTNGSCATNDVVWLHWVTTDGASGVIPVPSSYKASPPRELTPEEIAAHEEYAKRQREYLATEEKAFQERRELQRIAAEKKAKEDAIADKRAEELLLSCLDAEQRQEYAKDKAFHVRCKLGRRYHIHRSWSGHVARVSDTGKVFERLCAHPTTRVPLPDNMLAAKLMLETDPEHFRRIANITPVAIEDAPVPAGVN